MSPRKPPSKGPGRSPSSAKVARGAKARRPTDWLFWGLLALALLVRLWGVDHRLPDPTLGVNVLDDSAIEETDRTTMGRAWTMWAGGTRPFDLNPHTEGWPALSFYVALVLQFLFRAYRALTAGDSAAEFAAFVANHSDQFFLFARVAGALLGVATVWLTFRLGRRLFGRTAGLAAGLLLALNPLHVLTSQHIADPNLLALLFVLLATFPMLSVVEGAGENDSVRTGLLLGLAGACKYVPLVLGIPYLYAHAAGGQEAGRAEPAPAAGGGWLARLLRRRATWLGLLAILLGLFIASPYLFVDWKRTLHDVTVQRKSLFSDWVGQTEFPISLPTYLAVSLPHALGWPAYLLALVGLVMLFRAGKRGILLGLIPVTMIVANGMLKAAQERYVIPAVPFLFIGAALAFERGVAWLRARARAPWPAAAVPTAAVVGLLAVGWGLPEYAGVQHELSLPDSRHEARRWINAHIDPSAGLVTELYGPIFQQRERQLVIWPFFATQATLTRVAYHPEFLDGLDYICLSGEISRRFESEPEKYPVETRYYRWLDEHAPLHWRSDDRGMAGPRLEVRQLPHEISTLAERDSISAAQLPAGTGTTRVSLWCLDMAKYFLQRSQPDRTEEWSRRGLLVKSPMLDPQLWIALAAAEYRLGRNAESEKAAAIALRSQPKNAMLHFQRGVALHALGRFPEALEEFRVTLALNPDPRFHVNAARSLVGMGRYEDALAELEQVPPGHAFRATALHDEGIILLQNLHRTADGVDALKESLELDPNQEGAAAMRQAIARAELGGR